MEVENKDVLSGLHSSKSTRRLEQIAFLRARGVGEHVDLPQLVVCGDQSAGKSSVLEGITGLPFPRQDGVCTRFATEIILQHSITKSTIFASVLPASSRRHNEKLRLGSYERALTTFQDLPLVIAEVGSMMGLKGFGDIRNGPAFSRDVLRVEVFGPIGLHLTVVDLPGMIAVASEEQTDDDVQTVQSLVESYIANPRTIILAVVQAGNDIANQGIIQKSKKFDKIGQRTVGVITKPDLINEGSERRIALLAMNLDTTKLKLGYFLVKNPTPSELAKGVTVKERQEKETTYFQSSPWKEQNLSMDRVGVVALRSYLQILLDKHIEMELPKVREEIRALISKVESEIDSLGERRPSIAHMRMFLSRLAMRFHGLTMSALNGTYHEMDSVFFSSDDDQHPTRLRAMVHQWNTGFADYMRSSGQKRKIVERSGIPTDCQPPTEEVGSVRVIDNGDDSEDEEVDDDGEEEGQLLITETQMKEWVKQIYLKSRGKELPGNYNHILLSELFFIQSSRWLGIARDHIQEVSDGISSFISWALKHITSDDRVFAELSEITDNALHKNKIQAEKELAKLDQDEKRQPITYNHYFTDNVQKSRQDSTRQMVEKAMDEAKEQDWNGKFHVSNNQVDAKKLLAFLQRRIIVNMDDQACMEALAGLQAYYKVASKTFIDNVCRQVVERYLLQPLPGIFCPETIAGLQDEDLERIAAERPDHIKKRAQLEDLHSKLSESLRNLVA